MTISHALVLNLHQPCGNLAELLDSGDHAAHEILCALDRMPRSLWGYEDVARVHLSLSGTLLETLADPVFQQRVYGVVKCGDLLWYLQNERIFRVLGTGYYHPVLPLTPPSDWEEQLTRWQGIARHLLWRTHFGGFWPPEMGFSMELIPTLKRLGYRYVLVDSEHVEPKEPMRWDEIRYRPHVARYGGEEIVIVVRDRELSDAQESGMSVGWFESELAARTRHCDFPPLVTTCSDGDNGGWFRNPSPGANFWGSFYGPLLERATKRESPVRPVFIEEYLERHGARGLVEVRAGAWNTGWHDGRDFLQWTDSHAQKDALRRVSRLSDAFHAVRRRALDEGDNELLRGLDEAHWRLLRAQTSCNFFWGEAWVDRCHRDLDEVEGRLGSARVAV